MRKDDNSHNYFQGKRASQLLQSNDPINRFSEFFIFFSEENIFSTEHPPFNFLDIRGQ